MVTSKMQVIDHKPRTEKTIVSRWGNPIADDRGYITIPGWILRNYHRCKVSPLEMMFITHVMSFKYDHEQGKPENAAKPSLATIATYMGRDVKNVRRLKQSLIKKKLLTIHINPGNCDEYDFGGLTNQCLAYEINTDVQNCTQPAIDTPPKSVPTTPPKNGSTPLPKMGAEELEVNKKRKTRNSPRVLKEVPKASKPKLPPQYGAIFVLVHRFGFGGADSKSARGRAGDAAKALLEDDPTVTPEEFKRFADDWRRKQGRPDFPCGETSLPSNYAIWKATRSNIDSFAEFGLSLDNMVKPIDKASAA